MQAQHILNGLTLLLLYSNMLFHSIAADRLRQMSILLSYGGWRDLEPLEIVEDGEPCKVEKLLSGKVTADNVDDKIRQAHHFLSCQYAIVFLTYNYYVYSLADECTYMEINKEIEITDKRQCVNKFRQIFDPEILVTRMLSALSFLDSIRQPQTAFIKDVFDILTKFSEEFEPISFRKKDDDVYEYIANEEYLWSIVRILKDLEKITNTFYENHCGPMWYLKKRKFSSSTYGWVKYVLIAVHYSKIGYVDRINKLYTMANFAINGFLISYYTRMGFVPDSTELNAAVLNEKIYSDIQVQLANDIPRYSGWSSNDLNYLRIIADDRNYTIFELQDIEVDEENIDRKVRYVYQFLSCYYVEVLTELLLYNKSISKFFKSESIRYKYDFLQSFVETIKKSDPVIMQMKDILLFLQQLFPQTSFDKYMLKTLNFYKNSIEMMKVYLSNPTVEDYSHATEFVLYIPVDYKLLDQINFFLNKLTEIEFKLFKYNLKSCYAQDKLNQYEVPENSQTDRENKIEKIIESFINVVPSLGFIYEPLSNPAVTLMPTPSP